LIGGNFTDFAAIFDAVDDDPMLGVCIDTAHAFAFGYDLTEGAGLDLMLREIDSAIGLRRVMALHVNDSKVECGRNLDRHENLGQGHIGYEGIARVLLEPRLVGIPAILETPGFDGEGPDKGNLDIMRSLAGRLNETPEVIAKRAKRRAARKRSKAPVAKRVPAKAEK
jgi:apurinic endonuclease APN1